MTLTSGQLEKLRRDQANQIVISNPEECYHCHNKISMDDSVCSICSFPQKGSQEDMRRFVWEKRKEKQALKEAQEVYINRLKKARYVSFALAGLFVLGFTMETDFFKFFDLFTYGVYAFFIVSFVLSGIQMLKYPRVCASISLALYILWIVFQTMNGIEYLKQGILLKVIFLAGLIYGVKEAFLSTPPKKLSADPNILDENFISN